jgi:PAS domain S-box-containing protein
VRRTLAGESCSTELESVRKDGTRVRVEVRTIPIRHRGQPHVLAVSRDITEQKRAAERLLESEERYRLLFEMESDAIILADANTLQHIDANRAALELYGYSRKEMLKLRSTDLSAEPEKTQSAMHSGTGTTRVPLRYHRKKDGTVFPVDITANFELQAAASCWPPFATLPTASVRMRNACAWKRSCARHRRWRP